MTERVSTLIYKAKQPIEESQNGHRLVLPANVRALVDDAKAFTVQVIEEGGKRKIVLEPRA